MEKLLQLIIPASQKTAIKDECSVPKRSPFQSLGFGSSLITRRAHRQRESFASQSLPFTGPKALGIRTMQGRRLVSGCTSADIAVRQPDFVPLTIQNFCRLLRQCHRAMPAPGAAQSNRQIALSFSQIVGQQVEEH